MATRTEMDLPAGIREAIDTLIQESVRCGLYDAPRKAQTAAHEALVARLLALLAPEPDHERTERMAQWLFDHEYGADASPTWTDVSEQARASFRYDARSAVNRIGPFLAPEPEPSDAEIEAGAKALHGDSEIAARAWSGLADWHRDEYRHWAKAVLAAARAARQTGGERE